MSIRPLRPDIPRKADPTSLRLYSAYNDMCYLSERYAPLDGLDRYDPLKDPSVTGARIIAHADE